MDGPTQNPFLLYMQAHIHKSNTYSNNAEQLFDGKLLHEEYDESHQHLQYQIICEWNSATQQQAKYKWT